MQKLIYFDNNSTTKIDERVIDSMLPFMRELYGNNSSTHNFGNEINKTINDSRYRIAEIINASPKEIIFTSGATEGINLILKGLSFSPNNQKKHIITVSTEHKAVLDTCKYLETLGFEIEYLPVDNCGLIDLDLLKEYIRKDTLLVSVMYVNNETGVIQDIKGISRICKNSDSYFMCDATQAVGKLLVDVNELGIDIMTFSAHKFYGPKGIGVLYLNTDKINQKNIIPLLHGGGQENGLRSGTTNVSSIVGMCKALNLALLEMDTNINYIGKLRDLLESELLKFSKTFINRSKTRIFNTTNICFHGEDASILIGKMKNVAISNGSACNSSLFEPSHVLKNMGLSNDDCNSSIRFSLGKFNSEEEVYAVVDYLKQILKDKHA